MKKRNVGERGESYFDSIDLQILEKLNTAQNIGNVPHGYSALDLAKSLNLKHKNLKPHIDKLLKLDLIFPYKIDSGKVLLWTSQAQIEYIYQNDIWDIVDNPKEQKEIKEKLSEQKIFLDYLKKVRSLNDKDNLMKDIETDLRKLKSELSPKKR